MLSDLGDHGFTDTDTNTKVRMLQDSIYKIEAAQPWPFLETTLNLNFDGTNAAPTNTPADLKQALHSVSLITNARVLPLRQDDLEDRISGQFTLSGNPSYYYFDGPALKFWPVPPAGTGTVRFRYIKFSAPINSASLETAILIPPRHHRVIVVGALMSLYDMEDDTDLSVRYEQYFNEGLQRMELELLRQQYDQPDYVRVTDPDDWDFEVL